MITVTISRNKNTFDLLAKGHAGYKQKGEDIYCSAVSILLYTLVESIQEEDLLLPAAVVMDSGDAMISVTAKKETAERIAGLFSFVKTGIKLLSINSPEYVKLI